MRPFTAAFGRHLARAVVFCLGMQALTAQGPYYVNGLTGSDASTQGQSPSSPWKTITYALAHIPPQTSSTSATLYIEGNQTYSPSTNGESYPITPAYNVWIEGTFLGHGVMPVLNPGAGGTAFELDPNVSYFRNVVTYRYLDFEDGAYGIKMGSNPGFRHRPRVQDCVFRGQSDASISMTPNGTSGDDPRFFQNSFQSSLRGIYAQPATPNSRVIIDADECTFRSCGTGMAIHFLPNALSTDLVADLLVRSCTFEDCGTGLSALSSAIRSHYSIAIEHCRIQGCPLGLRLEASTPIQGPDHTVSIRDTTFLECQTGLERITSPPIPLHARQVLNIEGCTFAECGTGLSQVNPLSRRFYNSTSVVRSTFERCSTGWHIAEREPYNPASHNGSGHYTLNTMRACRINACATGIYGVGISSLGTLNNNLAISSTMFTGNDLALSCPGGGPVAPLQVTNATFAGNLTALDGGDRGSFSHSIFDGNINISPIAPFGYFSYCCFDQGDPSWISSTNLTYTPAQLDPVFHKLTPQSPCRNAGSPIYSHSIYYDYEGDPVSNLATNRDIGADFYQPDGSAHPYGTGGFGAFNVFPKIGTTSADVRIGQPLTVTLQDAIMPYFQVSALYGLLSLGWTDLPPSALGFDLSPLGLPNSYLWNDAGGGFFPVTPVTPSGTASITFTIPNLPALVGETFTHQWFAVMPPPYGIISSDGLRVTVGQ